MKKLFALILLLSSFSSWGAIKYYDDYPINANPPTNFIISLQTKDKTAGGIPYNYWELWQMSDWLAVNGLAGQGSNVSFTVITNNTFINTNVAITFLETNNTFVNTNVLISTSNSFFNTTYVTNLYSTNITVETITNVTFVGGTIFTTNFYSTNITVDVITNNTFYSTNVVVQNITNQNFYTTNITVEQPGGFTNMNLTPLTVMFADFNSAESSIPNAPGVLTNNGSGGVGFSQSLSLQELDAQNFYPTNMFTGLTNYGLLGTDGDGKLTAGSATITNLTVTNLTVVNLYAQTNFSTNLYFVNGKGNTLIITNNLMLDYLSASKLLATDGAKNVTNADVNATLSFSGNVLGVAPGGSPSLNLASSTNYNYMMPTNTGGGSALVFGGIGTAATLYTTNITAATTLAAFTITTSASAGGFKLYCSCSGGTDRILTFPNGCVGPGLGTPPAVTVTNAKAAWFDVIVIPGVTTNVFWSPVF